MAQAGTNYPVVFDVKYPDGPQDRLKALIRIILAIPILIILMAISGGSQGGSRMGARTGLSRPDRSEPRRALRAEPSARPRN